MPTNQPDGFLALPNGGQGAPVLVLHAWWGLNDTIKGLCTRLADAGFVAFAPDLYHGRVAATIEGAEALAQTLDSDGAAADVARAVAFLYERAGRPAGGLAVIGFSLGAWYAGNVSADDPQHVRAVVIFYGAVPIDYTFSRAAYLGHFAENDPYEPREYVDEMEANLRAAGRPAAFYTYPHTGHWFFEPDRTGAYHPEAAALAWERTLAFLKESV